MSKKEQTAADTGAAKDPVAELVDLEVNLIDESGKLEVEIIALDDLPLETRVSRRAALRATLDPLRGTIAVAREVLWEPAIRLAAEVAAFEASKAAQEATLGNIGQTAGTCARVGIAARRLMMPRLLPRRNKRPKRRSRSGRWQTYSPVRAVNWSWPLPTLWPPKSALGMACWP